MEVGLRVVRGPDWRWGEQDGGEGFAGTVVEIGKPPGCAQNGPGSADKTPDKTVIVQWDHGTRSNYRIGYMDSYDLLIFDNAPAGVKHTEIICDGCGIRGISGILWKCSRCHDYDLCTQCYMADMHDLQHPFLRYLTPAADGIPVSARENCTKIPLQGIFIGATVVRGPDWEWGNQDGGRGKQNKGRVMDIRGWDNESNRSVATVTWSNGQTNVYRLGYKGCVDLCCVKASTAGTYYKEHLPLLGQPIQMNTDSVSTTLPNVKQTFNVGDKVKVRVDVETLQNLQSGHGGWNPRMADYIDQVGSVHRVTDKGDIRVQYNACDNRWTFNPDALTKLPVNDTFSVGDIVRVKTDMNAVKCYQKGHGEWTETMKLDLGKTGKVIKVYPDGDVRVDFSMHGVGHIWTFNALSVMHVESNTKSDLQPVNGKIDTEVQKLLREAARGEAGVAAVREFLRKNPHKVDARAGGPCGGNKTCLQIAAHQGQIELCQLLLEKGASVYAADEDGDTPLHYAAFGNQPEIMKLLLSRNAQINAINQGKCSALHIAVNKQQSACVKLLLRYGCDVNLQDSYGDTALHDAIGKDALDIVDALCANEQINFSLCNMRGFNVLHHAALKGNAHATRRLVSRARHLVNAKKNDGFAALHLAALNGHREVASILLSQTQGNALVDVENKRRQTPLYLAASQSHWALVELLVNHNARIGAADEDGDTALHIAITKGRHLTNLVNLTDVMRDAPKIHSIFEELSRNGSKTDLAMICFLVNFDRSGDNILENARNKKGKTPLELLQNDPDYTKIAELLRSFKYPLRAIDVEVPNQTNVNSSPDTESSTSKSPVHCEGCSMELAAGDSAAGCANCSAEKIRLENGQQKEKIKNMEEAKGEKKKDESSKLPVSEKDLERLRYLETKLADLEEAHMCSICMERRRNVAFLCGHGACDHCAAPLKTCHMCRQTITQKINLY